MPNLTFGVRRRKRSAGDLPETAGQDLGAERELVQIIRPRLHHLAALRQMLGKVLRVKNFAEFIALMKTATKA